MDDTRHAVSILKLGRTSRYGGNSLARMRLSVLPLLLLLGIALALCLPVCAQGTCGDGVCELSETMQSCPQDCGIVLVDEDFEDGQAQGWYYDPASWEIITEGANHVWRTTQQAYASTGWAQDIAWFLRARRVNSDVNLYFRASWLAAYALRLEPARLVLWTERDGVGQDLVSADMALGTSWHDYRIDAVGHQITVTVDGGVVIPYTGDADGPLHGVISLEAFAADGARFDDIYLYSVTPQCYDGQQNGDETGVDCGGSCPFQDCCANRAWDATLGEGGVDCGGICSLACLPAGRTDRWTQTNGPWLEYIRRIRFDPDDPDTLLASSNTGSGVVKSSDAGRTWHDISGPAGAGGLSPMNVFGLAMDPLDKNTLYAGTANGRIYVTHDGGAIWELLWHYTHVDDAIWTLEVDPVNRDRLFAGMGDYTGCDGRIYLSDDRGLTWQKVLDVDPANAWDNGFISSLTFDPTDPNTLYATTGIGDWCGGGSPGDPNPVGFGIWKSTDRGDSWFPINNGLADLTVSHLVIDPSNPQTLYAGVGCVDDDIYLSGNVFKSTNGGANWQMLDGVSPDSPVTRLALHPDDPQKVYALGYGGVFLSEDGGATWSRLHDTFKAAVYTFFYEHAFAPDDPQTMYAGTYAGGIIKSVDGGRNWFEVNGLRHLGEVLGNSYGTALDPSDPDTMYATTIGGVFKTTNGGEAWRFIGQGIFPHLRQIAIDPTNPQRLYLGGDSQTFYTSNDGGDPASFLAFDKGDHTVYRLDSGSLPWQPVLSLPDPGDEVYDLLYDPQQPGRTYATTRLSSLWRSTDSGATWSPANSGLPGGAALRGLGVGPVAGTLYAGQTGTPGRLHTSADGGDTWSPLNDDLTFTTIHAFAVDPSDPDVAYAGAWGGGTWKTTDGGVSWALLPEAPVSAAALAVDPSDPQTIYATDRTEPTLWQSADGGQRWWRRFHAGDAYSRLQALAVDPHQADTVYVSAFKHGGYGAEGSLFRVIRGGYADVTGVLPRVAISLAISPDQPGLLLASTHVYGLYRSTDSGQNWQAVAGGLPEVGFNAMAWEPGTGALWAGACSGSFPDYMRPPGLPDGDDEPGLYRSTDGGQTWHKRLAGIVGKGFAFVPGAIYAAADDQIYLSTDGGQTWSQQPGGPLLGVSAVAIGGTRLYAATLGGGVHTAVIKLDHSLLWQGSQGPTAEIHAIQLLGLPGTLYATSFPGGVFKSTDGGASWQEANFGLPGFSLPDPARNGYYTLAANPTDPDNLYLGIYGYGVYRSEDGAATWLPASTGLGNRYVYSLLVEGNGDYVWASTNDGLQGLWRSPTGTPGRLSWSPAPDAPPSFQAITSIEINPENPDEVAVAAFPAGVFSTPDGGAHWYERSNNLYVTKMRTHGVGFEDGYYQLAQDPLNPRHLFFGTYGGQVYETRDGGQSWDSFEEGLMREGSIYAFEAAADDSRLYVSQKAGGVSRRALDPAAPQVRVVSGDGTPCTDGSHLYTRVMVALVASNAGDRVVVCPGYYAESVTVDRAVRLESFAGPSLTYLSSAVVSADGTRVAGFRLHELTAQLGVEAELLGNVVMGNNVYLPLVLKVQ